MSKIIALRPPPLPCGILIKYFRGILKITGVVFVNAGAVIYGISHFIASIYNESGLYWFPLQWCPHKIKYSVQGVALIGTHRVSVTLVLENSV